MSTARSRWVVTFALAVGLCLAAGVSQASILGELWLDQPAGVVDNALISSTPVIPPDALFVPAAINYDSRVTDYTVGGFLKHPSFFNTSPTFSPAHTIDNTFLLFTGQTFLQAGANAFVTPHDDGFELLVKGAFKDAGFTMPFDLQEGGPTAPVSTPYTVYAPAAGVYSFILTYAECCGPPAVLGFQVNGAPVGVPEPTTLLLLGAGLLGVAGFRWRKN